MSKVWLHTARTINIVLIYIFFALVLNLLKNVLERSKTSFNRFRTSAGENFQMGSFAAICYIFIVISSPLYGRESITVTATLLKQDKEVLKKYVMESVASDIKRAKQAGKMLAHAMGGVSNYAYDSIPWDFFADQGGIKKAFDRLCDDTCVRYIEDGKCEYKREIQRKKPRINKSQLGEFLHRRLINTMNISDADKKILNADPAKTDEFMRQGIINKDDYMFYNVLNLILQYYLEKEFGKNR